jgi:hypothetical protein
VPKTFDGINILALSIVSLFFLFFKIIFQCHEKTHNFSLKFLNIYLEKKIAETKHLIFQCQKNDGKKIFRLSLSSLYFLFFLLLLHFSLKFLNIYVEKKWPKPKRFVSYNCKFCSTTVDFVLFVSYNCSTTVLYKSTRFYNCTTNFTTVTFCNNWLATLRSPHRPT